MNDAQFAALAEAEPKRLAGSDGCPKASWAGSKIVKVPASVQEYEWVPVGQDSIYSAIRLPGYRGATPESLQHPD